jgi:predicted TPR repeat methyltransferase
MSLTTKIRTGLRGVLQGYGSLKVKSALWNAEFASGHWDSLEKTSGDCVYPWVEKYAVHGSILDLGCGSGSTGVELALDSYRDYTGVDISDVALANAEERSQEAGRAQKNRFDKSDFSSYTPGGKYNVILFRESIYYVPQRKVKPMLDGYAGHLAASGVFIVRLFDGDSDRSRQLVKMFENDFNVLERYTHPDSPALIVIFEPDFPDE